MNKNTTDELNEADRNRMKISHKKTKMILFIPGTARDFHPKFSLKENQIDIVEETKLLGVKLVDNGVLIAARKAGLKIKLRINKNWQVKIPKKYGKFFT